MTNLIEVSVTHKSEPTRNGNIILTLTAKDKVVKHDFGTKVIRKWYCTAVRADQFVPEVGQKFTIDLALFQIKERDITDDNGKVTGSCKWLHEIDE